MSGYGFDHPVHLEDGRAAFWMPGHPSNMDAMCDGHRGTVPPTDARLWISDYSKKPTKASKQVFGRVYLCIKCAKKDHDLTPPRDWFAPRRAKQGETT